MDNTKEPKEPLEETMGSSKPLVEHDLETTLIKIFESNFMLDLEKIFSAHINNGGAQPDQKNLRQELLKRLETVNLILNHVHSGDYPKAVSFCEAKLSHSDLKSNIPE